MVKITNGVSVFEVTRGAFDSIYSKQGYGIVEDAKPASLKASASVSNGSKTDDELFVEDIIDKPVSQWSKEEVKRFAGIKGIDITGTKNVTEAKNIIKGFIESED